MSEIDLEDGNKYFNNISPRLAGALGAAPSAVEFKKGEYTIPIGKVILQGRIENGGLVIANPVDISTGQPADQELLTSLKEEWQENKAKYEKEDPLIRLIEATGYISSSLHGNAIVVLRAPTRVPTKYVYLKETSNDPWKISGYNPEQVVEALNALIPKTTETV